MQNFWFATIGVLWAGFFLLEGFDFGVGILLPFVGSSDRERRQALRTIGPVWDGNEVWLIAAGGAMFAAFPYWYASVFSGFYLAFALLLVGLILRGIGLEYRGKAASTKGRNWCDVAIVTGSFLPALLLGVAFADFIRGVKLDAAQNMTGGFFSLLSPYALLGGVVTLTIFCFHGAGFLVLRSDGAVAVRAHQAARFIGPAAVVAALAFVGWTIRVRGGPVSWILGGVLILGLAAGVLRSHRNHARSAFLGTAIAAALLPLWSFAAMWPDVLPARNASTLSLTIYNASSSAYTLRVMTVVALIFTPVVIGYQIWAYWVLRARVTGVSLTDSGTAIGRTLARAQHSAAESLGRSKP